MESFSEAILFLQRSKSSARLCSARASSIFVLTRFYMKADRDRCTYRLTGIDTQMRTHEEKIPWSMYGSCRVVLANQSYRSTMLESFPREKERQACACLTRALVLRMYVYVCICMYANVRVYMHVRVCLYVGDSS